MGGAQERAGEAEGGVLPREQPRHFVEEDKGIPVGRHRSTIDRLCRQGKIVLFIGFARRLVGVIALKDSVCATSATTVRRLRALG